jgi:hypothetical protein
MLVDFSLPAAAEPWDRPNVPPRKNLFRPKRLNGRSDRIRTYDP